MMSCPSEATDKRVIDRNNETDGLAFDSADKRLVGDRVGELSPTGALLCGRAGVFAVVGADVLAIT